MGPACPRRPATPSWPMHSFPEFWPYYLAMHSRPTTRWLHVAGAVAGVTVSAYGVTSGRRGLLAGLPLLGYGAAWPAHPLVERNSPATFYHPMWSLRAEVKMLAMMLRGKDAELSRAARKWLMAHPEHRRRAA